MIGALSMNEENFSSSVVFSGDLHRLRPEDCDGDPDPTPSPSAHHSKSGKITTRMSNRCFARLTNAFSKKLENHGYMVALHFMHHSLARVHKTLRITPAMAAGIIDHIWSLEEIAMLADAAFVPAKCGPYKKRISN
jgi:hypothetical protein